MSYCRSCEAPVLWARTTKGKAIALDAVDGVGSMRPVVDPAGTLRPTGYAVPAKYGAVPEVEVVGGQASLDPHELRWRPHFATCPDSDDWRR